MNLLYFSPIVSCGVPQESISKSKSVILQKKISDCNGDQKKLFKIVDTLLGRNKEATLPKYDSPLTMASVMNNFFIDKIDNIRAEFPLLEANLPSIIDLYRTFLFYPKLLRRLFLFVF